MALPQDIKALEIRAKKMAGALGRPMTAGELTTRFAAKKVEINLESARHLAKVIAEHQDKPLPTEESSSPTPTARSGSRSIPAPTAAPAPQEEQEKPQPRAEVSGRRPTQAPQPVIKSRSSSWG